jgi:Icc-related predicted phosphoesterase
VEGKMLRIVAISDTHGSHRQAVIPDGDVFIHAGDFMRSGTHRTELSDFNDWLGSLPHTHKLVIAGNHDIALEKCPSEAKKYLTNCVYLEDSEVIIEGFKFYGSPISPTFYNWAFNVDRGPAIKKYWDRIPYDTDVLITHGPPEGILDTISFRDPRHLGCRDLRIRVKHIAPQAHIFWHIHGGAGQLLDPPTKFYNVSFLNESYQPYFTSNIAEFELDKPKGV